MLDHFRNIPEENTTKLYDLAQLIKSSLFDYYPDKIGCDIGCSRQIEPIYGIQNGTWVPSSNFYGGYDINMLLEVDHHKSTNIDPCLIKMQDDDMTYMIDEFAEAHGLSDLTINTIPEHLQDEFTEFELEYQKLAFQFGCIVGFKMVEGKLKVFVEVYVNSDEGYWRTKYNKNIATLQVSLKAFMEATNLRVLSAIYSKMNNEV